MKKKHRSAKKFRNVAKERSQSMDSARAFYYASNKVQRQTEDFEMDIYHNQDRKDMRMSMSKVIKAQNNSMNKVVSRIKSAHQTNLNIQV